MSGPSEAANTRHAKAAARRVLEALGLDPDQVDPSLSDVDAKPDGYRAGTRNATAKLCPEQVAEIRERYADGERPSDMAGDYPVCQRQLQDVATGRRWRHLPMPDEGES